MNKKIKLKCKFKKLNIKHTYKIKYNPFLDSTMVKAIEIAIKISNNLGKLN